MNHLTKIFEVLARESSFWLPDFSNNLNPMDQDNNFIADTETGYEYYCNWLTEYLTENDIPISNYQLPIISRLKKRKEISNVYILGNAGLSSYYLCNGSIDKYPSDFLDDPNPKRISNDDLTNFTEYFDIPKFRGLNSEENLQACLVFEFISIQQNELYNKIKGLKWLDIGWRPILKAGLKSVNGRKEKVLFTKNFINEIAYLISK